MRARIQKPLGRGIAVLAGLAGIALVLAMAEARASIQIQPPTAQSNSSKSPPPSPSAGADSSPKPKARPIPLRNFGKPADPKTLIPRILEEHNKIRVAKRLAPFVSNPKLEEAAQKHAEDMVSMSSMTHTGSDGSSVAQRLDRVAYPYMRAGENVAFGFPAVKGVMDGWMNSDGHRANILGSFTEVGIGIARNSRGVPYYCVDFGVSRGKAGAVAGSNSKSILKTAEELREMAKETVALLNAERAKMKLAPLKINSKLEKAAQTHARDMADQDKLSALGANGDNFLKRLKRVRYSFRTAAENLGSGPEEPTQLVESWLKSSDPDAKSNALGKFAQVGVSCCAAKNGTLYWCAIFGSPTR